MIIEQLTIKNWRGYRKSHTFRFQDGINLLVGRNEAGKSTLFEALTCILFDRHNSKTEEIRAIQPIGSSLGPEVTIQFRANGDRFRASKRFLQDSKSALYTERADSWELDHEGDAADAQLREILRGEAAPRTAARPEHRGLAQALWFLQSDGAIPKETWSNGVKHGLQGLVELATRSPVEAAIIERIIARFDEYWTPTGRVASNSDVGRLQAEIPELEEDLADLLEKARNVESYRSDLEETKSLEAEKRAEMERAQIDLAESAKRVETAEKLGREREVKERTKSEAEEMARQLRHNLLQVEDKQNKIKERREEVNDHEESLVGAATQLKVEATMRDRHARRWREELQPELKEAEVELRALHSLDRLRKLEKDRERLERHLEKFREIESQLEARRQERAELVAPDENEWKRFGEASQKLSVLRARIEASAVRVHFEWTEKVRKVTTQPSIRASENAEYIVTQPTEFQIEEVGKVSIRSGADTLTDLIAEWDGVEQEVQDLLTRFAVADADEMADSREKARNLDGTISALEKGLDEAEEMEPSSNEELARVKRDIEEETRGASMHPSATQKQESQRIRDEIDAKEEVKNKLIREIEEEQNAQETAGQKHLELVEVRQVTTTALAELKAEINAHEEAITAILNTYGTVEQLRRLVEDADEEIRSATSALDEFLIDYEEKVETPNRLHEHAKCRVQELDDQLRQLGNKSVETQARIEEAAEQRNYSKLADAEIELTWKRRRLKVVMLRAEGAKLLRELVQAREKKRSAALSGPIQELVNRWLRLLSKDNYDTLQIDHDLKPTAVRMAQYGLDLPLTSLSYGTREQVVVLLRLAIAVLVSDAERNLVVIDDRLVSADSVRMKRLCIILQEAAKVCQIVITTCNDTPYAGLGARIVQVPIDGNSKEDGT